MDWEREAASKLPGLLGAWLLQRVQRVEDELVRPEIDLELRAGDRRFVVEVKGSDDIATLDRAAAQLARQTTEPAVGLVVVPYMGPKARDWASQNRVSWVDLSGNAEIRAPDLCIVVSGEKNRYTSRGRPSNPFTARYSRVGRALLAHADRWWKQSEIAEEVHLPTGTVSKVIQRLDSLHLLERNAHAALRARAPSLLLDSWAQRYHFEDHTIRRYHLPARSGEDALRSLSERLDGQHTRFAATGLSGAWLYNAFAGFRLNTFYVDEHPSDPESLGLRPAERGENVWLVVPHDEGVFYERAHHGTWCAHPVQVYLDLAHLPERAKEAAAELRARRLTWRA
jgi:hypothetical protein